MNTAAYALDVPWWATMVPDFAPQAQPVREAVVPAAALPMAPTLALPPSPSAPAPSDPPTSPLVIRLPEPLPPAQDDTAVPEPSKGGPWSRHRNCGYSGTCCIVVIVTVVVCCVLLIAAVVARSSPLAMRSRSYLTVTVEIPATSLSTDLGAGLKCDFASTLVNAQPSVSFDNIALASFSLMDTDTADVTISSTDLMNYFNQSDCPTAAVATVRRRRRLSNASLTAVNSTCTRTGLQRTLKSIKVGFTALSTGTEAVNVSSYTDLLTTNLTYDNVVAVVEEYPCLIPSGVSLEEFTPRIVNISSVQLESEPLVLTSPLASPSPSAGYIVPSVTATFSALQTDSVSTSSSPLPTATPIASALGVVSACGSGSPSAYPTPSPSVTPSSCGGSATPSVSSSGSGSGSGCGSSSGSGSPSHSASASGSPQGSDSGSPSTSPSASPWGSLSAFPSVSLSSRSSPSTRVTPSAAPPSLSAAASAKPLPTVPPSPSTSSTASACVSATLTPPAPTSTSTPLVSATASRLPSSTPKPLPTGLPPPCTSATPTPLLPSGTVSGSPTTSASGTASTSGSSSSSATATPCHSASPCACPSPTPVTTLSPSACRSSLPSHSGPTSASPSLSGTVSLTGALSASPTASLCTTSSPSGSASLTGTPNPSFPTPSPLPSTSPQPSPTTTPCPSHSGSPRGTHTLTPSSSPSHSHCGSSTLSPSLCPSATPSSSPSLSHCTTTTPTLSSTLSSTHSPSTSPGGGGGTPSTLPSATPLTTPTPSASAPSPSALPSPSISPSPSGSDRTSASRGGTSTPPPSASLAPSASLSPSTSSTPSTTASPSLAPTSSYISPTGGSAAPTPTLSSTLSPSVSVSVSPTATASAYVVEVRTVAGGGKCCPPPNGVAAYTRENSLGYQDGVGTLAKFGYDAGWGLSFTSVNSTPLLVLADMRNHLIRGIDPVTYAVTTLAGGGGLAPPGLAWLTNMFPAGQCGLRDGTGTNALFLGPVTVSGADRNGRVYIPDFYNNRIRRMDLATREVVTVAGGGTGGGTCRSDGVGSNAAFRSLGFSAWVDVPTHVLYFRDWHQVVRLNLSDYNVTTLAGGGGPSSVFGTPCHTGWAGAFGKALFANGIGTAALLDQPRGMVIHPTNPNILFFSTNKVIATLELDTRRVSVWAGGGEYSNSEWPVGGSHQPSGAVGTNCIFAGDTALGLDTVNNRLIIGNMGANSGGVGVIDIGTRVMYWMAGGSSEGNANVQDGFGTYPTFSAANGITFWGMGGGGGMYLVFDSTYGLLRQIQSSNFGPTNTPTPSITPSVTPTPSSTPTFTPTPSPSPTYGSRTVTTLAGGGGDPSNAATRFGYANGIGTAATFSTPDTDPVSVGVRGITYANVNGPAIYIADTFNSLVRKLDLGTLAVTTIAGRPYTVSRGSNPRCSAVKYAEGVGSNALFCHTSDVEEYGGILYVCDFWNDAIRAVDLATNTVTTFMGGSPGGYGCNIDGSGTSAKFQHPFALTISSGRMFILDDNGVVRMVDMATRVSSSLAGGGGPQTPGASDFDGCHKANALVNGVGTNVIFDQPQDLAADATHVYVADYNSWTIRRVEIATGNTSTVAGGNKPGANVNKGGSLAAFHTPLRIAMDGFGNLDIVSGGQCLFALTLDSAAWATLVAGKGYGSGQCVSGFNDGLVATAGFGGLSSVAVGPSAYYVMDAIGGTVRMIDGGASLKVQTQTATPSVTPTLTPTMSPTPSVSPPPVVVKTLAGGGPANAAFADGQGTLAKFNHPHGLALDSSSPPNVIIADNANNVIRKVTPLGVVSILAGCVGQACANWDGTGTDSKFWGPSGIAKTVEGGADYFYVTDCFTCKVRKVSAAGVVTTVLMSLKVQNSNNQPTDGVGTNAYINCPNGVAVDSSGLLHVSGFFDSTIRRVTDPGASVTTFAGNTVGIGIGNAGVLLSGATYNHQDGTGTNALFYQPRGLAFDPSDNLYVCDSKNNALRKITPLGVVTTLGPSTTSSLVLNGPQSVAYWQGLVYVGDTYRLRIVYPSGAIAALAGTAGDNGYIDGSGPGTSSKIGNSWQGPMGLVVNPYDNLLYFSDTANNALRTVSFLYPSVSSTVTPSVTPTPSGTPSETPTPSITPTATLSPTATPSVSPSVSVSGTVSPTPLATPSMTPTATISPTPSSTTTPSSSPTASL